MPITPNFDVVGLPIASGRVRPEWIDQNDHMNVAYYVLAFDLAIDDLWARLGITRDYIQNARGSTMAAESHLTYKREMLRDDPYVVTTELLAFDSKRLHHFQRMYHAEGGYLAATAEWMTLHVNLDRRKVAPWAPSILAELEAVAREQQAHLGAAPPVEQSSRMRVKSPLYNAYPEN